MSEIFTGKDRDSFVFFATVDWCNSPPKENGLELSWEEVWEMKPEHEKLQWDILAKKLEENMLNCNSPLYTPLKEIWSWMYDDEGLSAFTYDQVKCEFLKAVEFICKTSEENMSDVIRNMELVKLTDEFDSFYMK